MIQKLSIQNFKSLKEMVLPFKSLNLLMGLNGMGKSSIIQSLLILRQSRDLSRGSVALLGEYTQIGKGKDAMYQYNNKENISINIETKYSNLYWTLEYNPDSQILYSNQQYENTELQNHSLFNSKFQYLNADRLGPQDDYQTSYREVIADKQVGIDGRFAIHFLNTYGNEPVESTSMLHPNAKSKSLIHQVDAWLSEITPGIKLNTTEIPNTDKVLLDYQFETNNLYTSRFRPKNVGFGISYVLPLIVSLLSASKDHLLIIENPESHIHPRGQAELGELIALTAQTGVQLIIETHSDHILNGIRVATKKGKIDKNNVGIFYIEKVNDNDEQFSKATNIKIDQNGELSEYPINFLDEWSNQLFKLL